MSFFVIEQQNDQAVAARPLKQQIGHTIHVRLFWLFLGSVITSATGVLMETWLSILPVLAMEIVVWSAAVVKMRETWCPVPRMLMLSTHIVFVSVLVVTTWCYVQKSPYVLGSPNLRGLVVGGIPVPSSDFRWATNGEVRATRAYGGGRGMRIRMVLRDQENCDAGWGMDLLRFNFRKFRVDYDPRFALMEEIEFDISGENGGERIGISMKSDRVGSSGITVSSDETRVPLSVKLTKRWQQVNVPLTQFARVNMNSVRNIAFYTDSSLGGTLTEPITVYVANIRFVPVKE